jgi:hypothetical protein
MSNFFKFDLGLLKSNPSNLSNFLWLWMTAGVNPFFLLAGMQKENVTGKSAKVLRWLHFQTSQGSSAELQTK